MKTNPFGLMAITRSVSGVPPHPAPLRLDRRGMPRFGRTRAEDGDSTDTPFAPRPAHADRPARLGAGTEALGAIGATAFVRSPAPEPAPRPEAASRGRPGVRRFPLGWLGRRWSRRRQLVQGELSLESVQVVRNDLRDADFAVVRPARAVAARLRETDPADAPPVLAVTAWRRWVGAFFRMGH